MKFATVEDILNECDILNGNLIEAGTYHGDCLARLAKCKNFDEIWSFDSYEGLPSDAEKDGNSDWKPGSFNVLRDDGFSSVEQAMDFIRKRVGREDIHVHLIKGWFKDSLTNDLGLWLNNKCALLHIDCDIYSSTKDFLEWIFKYDVLKPGCIIRYDDFCSTPLWTAGESKAHRLIEQKYNVDFTQNFINVFTFNGYK